MCARYKECNALSPVRKRARVQPDLVHARDCRAARRHAELPVDGDRLGLHRVAGDEEPFADLGEREMRREQREQAQLGGGQRRSADGFALRTCRGGRAELRRPVAPARRGSGRCCDDVVDLAQHCPRARGIARAPMYARASSSSACTETIGQRVREQRAQREPRADVVVAPGRRRPRCAAACRPQAYTRRAGPVVVEVARRQPCRARRDEVLGVRPVGRLDRRRGRARPGSSPRAAPSLPVSPSSKAWAKIGSAGVGIAFVQCGDPFGIEHRRSVGARRARPSQLRCASRRMRSRPSRHRHARRYASKLSIVLPSASTPSRRRTLGGGGPALRFARAARAARRSARRARRRRGSGRSGARARATPSSAVPCRGARSPTPVA